MTGTRPPGTGSSSDGSSCRLSLSDGSFNSMVQSVSSTGSLSSTQSGMRFSWQKDGLLRVLIDADGCFYNKRYQELLKKFIEENPEFISQADSQETVPLNTSAIIFQQMDYQRLRISRMFNLLKTWNKPEANNFWIESNFELTSFLLNKFRGYTDVVISVGSNRQSHRDDLNGCWTNSTSSIFSDLPAYADYLFSFQKHGSIKFDAATMTDFQNNFEPGETYKRIQSRSDDHKDYLWDEKKGSMIYANAHRTHVEVTDSGRSESGLIFVDDRKDILDGLYKCYKNKSALLPKGHKLYLVQYDGKIHHEYPVIEGTGELDREYAKTAAKMARECVVGYVGDREIADTVAVLNEECKPVSGKTWQDILPRSVVQKCWLQNWSTGWCDEFISKRPGLFASNINHSPENQSSLKSGHNISQTP